MNLVKKSLFVLSIMTMAPMHHSQASVPTSLKDVAKLGTLLLMCPSLGYYLFHSPVDRKSSAPIENIFKGKWDNVTGDFFNWDNITNFGDIIPGQRGKVYPYTLVPKESSEKEIKLPITNLNDISGFGLYNFCDKNMGKICKYAVATAIMYVLLYTDNITAELLWNALLDPSKTATSKLFPTTAAKNSLGKNQ